MPDIASENAWESDAPLVPRQPPPWFVPALAWLLVALFATALLAAIFVQVPETVRSRFVLVTEGGADPIQSPRQAVIEQVRVRPGQAVKKGETLFVMRVDALRDWRADTDAREESLRSLTESSAKLEEAQAASLRIKDGEIDQAEREVAFRTTHLGIMKDLVTRVEKLAATGLISEIELAAQRLALAQSDKDLELARKTLSQRQLERQGLENERSRQRIAEKSAADELRIRIASLQQPLASSPDGLLEIRAPYDAVCVGVTQQNAGGVVAAGEPLCQLSPTANRLQARLELPEAGLSRLESRQRVRLLFDAFPYQRFGVVTGAIDWITPAAVTRAQGSEFVALASLDKASIIAGGNPYPLKPGMKGEARITVGRRALIEFAFEPLRSLRENLKS
ncbi:MAG TPA: HlyD family efflux transporter periplasmic adaptor subunit [Thermoanaerobaculia bacterium]|nr:HlyD family efflux transporter periplasmic adaptor subunit [Thermoanaerobaculia bacterium]